MRDGTPKKNKASQWLIPGVFFGGALLLAGLGMLLLIGSAALTAGGGGRFGNVAVIHVAGVIACSGGKGGPFSAGVAGSDTIIDQLARANKDKNVKAIILRINSPGGSAAASQEIYQEIRRAAGKKKIVVSMGDVAASGGYYIACAADTIVANPATMTGSIGVIMELQNMEKLFGKIGLAPETVKSGPFKDIGSPSRALTQEERRILQGMIDQVYNQFVDDVTRGRKKMTREGVKKLADGRIYTGQQAKELGLVDELGGMRAAVRAAARLSGIKGEPSIVSYDTPSLIDMLMGTVTTSIESAITGALESTLPPRGLPAMR